MTPKERALEIWAGLTSNQEPYDNDGWIGDIEKSVIEAEYEAFNRGKEEGYKLGYEKGYSDARCIKGAALSDAELARCFEQVYYNEAYFEEMDNAVQKLRGHIEYLTCLLIDLQQDSRAYRRGIQDGLKMVVSLIREDLENNNAHTNVGSYLVEQILGVIAENAP